MGWLEFTKRGLFKLALALSCGASAGCEGSPTPTPLTLTVNHGTAWVREESIPASATLVADRDGLSLSISGNAVERATERLDWLRGSVPLGELSASGGTVTQTRTVTTDESGVLDVGKGSVVESYLPTSYVLDVQDYDSFDLFVSSQQLVKATPETIRFVGQVGLLCILSGSGNGLASSTGASEEINALPECSRLRPFSRPQ